MSDSDWKFQKSIREIEGKVKPSGPNYGWLGFGVFILSLASIYFGVMNSANAMACIMADPASAVSGIRNGFALMVISGLGIVISLALSGAGLATGRGGFPGMTVIALVALPFVYTLLQLYFDLPAITEMMPYNPKPSNPLSLTEAQSC